MVKMTITPEELAYVYGVSDAISEHNREIGRKERGRSNERHGNDRTRRLGLVGEYAVCKWLGVEWTNTGKVIMRYDAGKYQVRTRGKHSWELYCNANNGHDHSEDVFILATSEVEGVVQIHGWAYGHEIQKEPAKDVGGYGHLGHFLPSDKLHSLETLPR